MHFVVPCSADRLPQLKVLMTALEVFGKFDPARDTVTVVDQLDAPPFNRGLVRNVGALLSGVDPDDVLCFHDVDVCPVATADHRSGRRYGPEPKRGEVVHLYGHGHCLGGIVLMRRADFVRVGGYISRDTWGGEDVALEQQCAKHGVRVNRAHVAERYASPLFCELTPAGVKMSNETARHQFQTEIGRKMQQYRAPRPGLVVGDLAATRFALTEPQRKTRIGQKFRLAQVRILGPLPTW